MKFKKIMFVGILLLAIFAIGAVSASDVNDTVIANEDTSQIELSTSNEITEDNLQTSEENDELTLTDNAVLGDDSATYSGLAEEISESGNITLKYKSYIYDDGASAITIGEANKVIDGNGAVIDMAGSTIRAFTVSASDVTIKNLTIKNANYNGNGGAIYFRSSGTVTNCNFTDNSVTYAGGAVYFYDEGTVKNCNFTNNQATGDSSWGGAIVFAGTGNVTNCNFTNNTATYYGGAVHFRVTGTVTNCNFTNNSARYGGAIYIYSGTVTNCNFTGNTATYYGGAVYFLNNGEVSNCNFTDNIANDDGGAVYCSGNGEVINCNFTNNTAKMGNAIYINNKCTISDCDFTNNPITKGAIHSVTGDITLSNNIINVDDVVSDKNFTEIQKLIDQANDGDEITINGLYAGFGIPILITKSLTLNGQNNTTLDAKKLSKTLYITANNVIIKNIQFTSGYAEYGGAVYFNDEGSVSNCNFAGNTATVEGGAVYFWDTGTVSNCNFTDNSATVNGGAVYFWDTGTVSNCNFTDNSARNGGAVYFYDEGSVSNCNFTGNTATGYGGAIYFLGQGTVTNCNFTGNNATTGSAIYFYKGDSSDTLTVSNSTFLNNRANSEVLDVVKNDNNITITFTGQNNLLNAIYSREDAEVAFNNVKYWGANRITTISATISGSNKAAGQNITVGVVVNDKLVLNDVIITNENGTIVLDIIAGENYYISARHNTDSYYTEAETTITNNTKFNVNVTSKTTTNKTVNITAKSDIYGNFMPGKLLFILPNGTQINATYGANGTWWAVHEFDKYDVYQVNATYVGLDNVTINNGTITITKADSAITLDKTVFDYGDSINVATMGAVGITAKIDGNDVTVVDFTIPLSGLNAGTYNLTVTTIPDEDHNPVTVNATITINKLQTVLTGNAVTAVYNINKDLVITLKDSNGKALSGVKVTVDLNGAKTYITDNNGRVKVKTKGLAPKAYTAKITFNGNTNYEKSTKNVKVTVKKAKPKLTAKKKTFKKSVKVKKYSIVLKNNLKKAIKKAKVYLKVGKKTYKAKTNGKGKATFKIKKLTKKGKYKATVTYKGNACYNKATKKVNIKIR